MSYNDPLAAINGREKYHSLERVTREYKYELAMYGQFVRVAFAPEQELNKRIDKGVWVATEQGNTLCRSVYRTY